MRRTRSTSARATADVERFQNAVPIADRLRLLGQSASAGQLHWEEVDPVAARATRLARGDASRRVATWLRLAALVFAARAAVPPAVVVLGSEFGLDVAFLSTSELHAGVGAICGCLAVVCLLAGLVARANPARAMVAAAVPVATAGLLLILAGLLTHVVDQAVFGVAMLSLAGGSMQAIVGRNQ